MSKLVPARTKVDIDDHPFQFKRKLAGIFFSYRCLHFNDLACPFLLTVPINPTNYDDAMNMLDSVGNFQASTQGHSLACKKKQENIKNLKKLLQPQQNSSLTIQSANSSEIHEWRSDEAVLKVYISQNLKLGPKAIRTNLLAQRQTFSLKTIKETRKQIIDEIFPKDRKIAFHPSNCLAINAEDSYDDNLFKHYSQFPCVTKKKNFF